MSVAGIVSISLFAGAPAWAQAGVDDSTLLVVAVDDRAMQVLVEPALVIDGQRVRMRDDGSRVGDMAGDRIWMGAHNVGRLGVVGVALVDGDQELARLDLALPDDDRAFYAYKLRPDRTLAGDAGVRSIEGIGDPVGGGDGSSNVQVATVEEEDDTLGDDEVRVRVVLDDREIESVDAPRILIAQDGVEPLVLTDDGSVSGDTPGDRIWLGEVVVQRTQYLSFSVQDKEVELSELTVFLPSSGQAALSLRTTGGDPPVELLTEPVATGATQGPTGGGAASAASASGTVNVDRLSYVLWIGVALFAIAFAYLRSVVWKAWREDLRPVVRKLDRYLDRELEPEPADRDDEGRA